jgi:glutathione synthase/RimK-type ligase-like ATP-grasp enzyme
MEPKIYVIHENHEWTAPLQKELATLGLPYEDWFLDQGKIDLSEAPPEGIFYNRMSASSHTRGHRYAPEYTAAVLSWLEGYGRRVLNTSRALQLEVSKVAQYAALHTHDIRTPHTIAAVGKENIIQAAKEFDRPFITKHNRAGKGLGVRLFQSTPELEKYVNGLEFEEPLDGITLIQEYIEAPDSTITRCEFVGGKFLYAVQVDTSEGFELCPADACRVDGDFITTTEDPKPKFTIVKDYENPNIEKYERFLQYNGIQFAGIECIKNEQGDIFTYDVNTNTNYNQDAEAVAELSGMRAIAEHLGSELKRSRLKN